MTDPKHPVWPYCAGSGQLQEENMAVVNSEQHTKQESAAVVPEYKPFTKIARLSRECTVTEKIDGTNGCIFIGEDGAFLVGSRSRWITPADDNFGFARWAHEHKDELLKLGPGRHFGEWWGSGIQRGYGLQKGEKRFSLFNTYKWSDAAVRPACCHVVPVLATGLFSSVMAEGVLESLRADGSLAAPGFMNPEGIIIYHHAANFYFKKTLHKDEEWKGKTGQVRSQENATLK